MHPKNRTFKIYFIKENIMRKKIQYIIIILILAYFNILANFVEAKKPSNFYFGTVILNSPEGLGNIDLAFHLEFDAVGNVNSTQSYILLDQTVLFPAVNQIDGEDVGPMIESGYLMIPDFHLETEPFTATVTGKTVTRQITLDGQAETAAGESISGTYEEVMTGYLPEPITISGSFVLFRPVSMTQKSHGCQFLDTLEPIGELTLDEIKAGGNEPGEVEFDELSCAMYYHHNPGEGLVVSEATLSEAIIAYKGFLGSN